jgi:hypothetical protein
LRANAPPGFRFLPLCSSKTVPVTVSPSWRNKGPRLVARVAEGHLTDKTKQTIAELLEQGETLADAATYPDDHKGKIKGSAPWHFVQCASYSSINMLPQTNLRSPNQ